ncbi:MAG TPA: stage II sporulation protein P [Limnochordales bacterium]
MARIAWARLRWRLRVLRIRVGRLGPRTLYPPARQLFIFWLVLAAGAGLVALDRVYPQARARLAGFIAGAWKDAAAGAGQLLPGIVSWAEAQGRLGEVALREGLPMALWETGPEPPPPPDWRRDVRALVFAVTRYDIGNPQTLLEAAMPGLAAYSQDRRRGLLPPPAPGAPRVTVAPADEWVPRPSQAAQEPPAGSRIPGAAPRPPAEPPGPPAATPAPPTEPPTPPAALPATPVEPPAPSPPVPPPPGAVPVPAGPPADAGTGGEPAAPGWQQRLRAVQWGDGCRILIYHTHTSETYRTGSFAPGREDAYHLWNTTETGIVEVGRAMRRRLEEVYGIPTCHAVEIHDWPSHPRAYIEARATVQQVLARNPNLEIVLDVHRDAPAGLVATVGGQRVAQVALVVGANTAMHPGWRANLAFAQALAERIQDRWPGMFRRVIERPDSRLNQDLHPRAVLVEIGSYDNHLDEAVRAAELLADVLAEMLLGIVEGERGPGAGAVR